MGLFVESGVFILCERRAQPLYLTSRKEHGPIRIAAITVSELLLGVHRADTPGRRAKRQQWVDRIITTIPSKPFDASAARVHARVHAELLRRGTP